MEYRPVIGGGLVLSGLLLAGIQLLQLTQLPGSSTALAFNTLPFVLVAGAISYTGLTVARDETYETYATRIISWGVGSAGGFVAVFILITGTTQQTGLTLLLGAVDAGSAGGLAGLLIGLYDTKTRRTLATVEAFADKLTGMNQYGKVLNQSTDIESVGSLCIEVIEFVLGGDGAMFVVGDDSFEPVSSTILEADAATVNRAAAGLADHEPLVTVTESEGFAELRSGEAGSTLGVQIPAGQQRAVLFAVFYGLDEPDEETIDLLEILAAHVATALSSIQTAPSADDQPFA